MPDNKYVGWDIGGAHLKMASIDADGTVLHLEQHATPLWQGLDTLGASLSDIKTRLPKDKLVHTITITGELADLFQDRQQGVDALLSEFCKVFEPEQVKVYAGPAGLISLSEASGRYRQVASANWHATATYIASEQKEGMLIDIGSSTTDLIPFKAGRLYNRGYSDQERMVYDELLYTGIVRTPLMAIVNKVPFAGEWQSVAAEQFATMADVYRITGELKGTSDLMPTADGAGKQVSDSVRRVARMLGSDVYDTRVNEAYYDLARYIAEEQIYKISRSLHRVMSANHMTSPLHLIGAGAGRFLVAKLALRYNYQYTDFEQRLSVIEDQKVSAGDCATAVSVALLARLARLSG